MLAQNTPSDRPELIQPVAVPRPMPSDHELVEDCRHGLEAEKSQTIAGRLLGFLTNH